MTNPIPISRATPVTIGIVVTLCAGCFWLGRLSMDHDQLARRFERSDQITREWREQTFTLLAELKGLSADNKRRLDRLGPLER